MNWFLKIVRFLLQLNTAELTVLSFLSVSLVGGVLLTVTESGREVRAVYKTHRDVVITTVSTQDATDVSSLFETHTFLIESTRTGETFIDMLFTAVSAVSVTGLTVTDFSQFSLAGQIIVLVLIQIGGLGVIFVSSVMALAVIKGVSKRISFRALLSQVLNTKKRDALDMLKYILLYTIVTEAVGFLVMGIHLQFFVSPDQYFYINPWWWSLFHSVSAFNNAGFSLMPNSMINFAKDPVIMTVLSTQIVIGGLGFPVLFALFFLIKDGIRHQYEGWRPHIRHNIAGIASIVQVKIALLGTLLLIVLGTCVTLLFEWNRAIPADTSIGQHIMIGLFHSVSSRTAGFNSLDLASFQFATLFLTMILMFIGANPGGTSGGVKIHTIAVIIGYLKDWYRVPGQPIVLLGRKISKFALSHAIRLFFFSTSFIILVFFSISHIEGDFLANPDDNINAIKILFEVISAFGTTGLSMGFPQGVSSFATILEPESKMLLILSMLVGRIGPIAVIASFPWHRHEADAILSPDQEKADKIQIG